MEEGMDARGSLSRHGRTKLAILWLKVALPLSALTLVVLPASAGVTRAEPSARAAQLDALCLRAHLLEPRRTAGPP